MSRAKRSRIAIIHLQKSLPLWEQSLMMAGIRDIAKIRCTLHFEDYQWCMCQDAEGRSSDDL